MRYTITPDQKYILSILKETKAMRKSQAFTLLHKLSDSKDESYILRCLDQLRHMRKIVWQSEDLFTLSQLWAVPADAEVLSAIDIMLDLTEIRIPAISSSTRPYTLCFLSEQHDGIGDYAVIAVHPGEEVTITTNLRHINNDSTTIVFLLQNISQAKQIQTSLTHFFATYADGNYHYFSEN